MVLLLALLATSSVALAGAAPSFTIANDEFVQDGKVAHLRAGCIHYSVRSCPAMSSRWLLAQPSCSAAC